MNFTNKKYYYILGLQSYASHDSGASILKFSKGNKPEIVSISEERLSRKKYNYSFPALSIKYCMDYFGIKNLSKIDLIVSDWIRKKQWYRSGPGYNYSEFDYLKEKFKYKKKIIQIRHHLAHAASTYYTSGFKESAILIIDGNGSDLETTTYYIGSGTKISKLDSYHFRGVGDIYELISSKILKFGPGGEGKTMGLAPYGRRDASIKIDLKKNGIETDFSKFVNRMPRTDVISLKNEKLKHLAFANKVKIPKFMSPKYKNWAFAAQDICEKIMIHLGGDIKRKSKSKNLCLAGGVALNSVGNEKIKIKNKYKNIHIFPACNDSGISYGLVVWAYYNIFNQKKKIIFDNAYLGKKDYQNDVDNLLKGTKINYKDYNSKFIAKVLSQGKVIGFYSGYSEYGPRALGNRSILADPRRKNMRNYINKHVKHRELFRPFAPAVLQEDSKKFFGIENSPYMLRVSKTIRHQKIPAVVHVDKTARVQTVSKKNNSKFYDLIKEFKQITNIPCVLNTSFNDKGEPIVEKPIDAMITFLKTKLDYLVLENNIICKKDISKKKQKSILKSLIKKRSIQINIENKKTNRLLFKKLNKNEFTKRKIVEEIKSVDIVLEKPLNKLIQFYKKQNTKIIFYGTEDHTNSIRNLLKTRKLKDNKIIFLKFKPHSLKKKKSDLKFLTKNKLPIIISSHEYFFEIKKFLNKKEIFEIYDNSSRSLTEYLKTKAVLC